MLVIRSQPLFSPAAQIKAEKKLLCGRQSAIRICGIRNEGVESPSVSCIGMLFIELRSIHLSPQLLLPFYSNMENSDCLRGKGFKSQTLHLSFSHPKENRRTKVKTRSVSEWMRGERLGVRLNGGDAGVDGRSNMHVNVLLRSNFESYRLPSRTDITNRKHASQSADALVPELSNYMYYGLRAM